MNDDTKDGGPAFPQPGERFEDGDKIARSWEAPGMTLRDYFAAKASERAADALCDIVDAGSVMETHDPVQKLHEARLHAEQHARAAYIYADAMLRAREAK